MLKYVTSIVCETCDREGPEIVSTTRPGKIEEYQTQLDAGRNGWLVSIGDEHDHGAGGFVLVTSLCPSCRPDRVEEEIDIPWDSMPSIPRPPLLYAVGAERPYGDDEIVVKVTDDREGFSCDLLGGEYTWQWVKVGSPEETGQFYAKRMGLTNDGPVRIIIDLPSRCDEWMATDDALWEVET